MLAIVPLKAPKADMHPYSSGYHQMWNRCKDVPPWERIWFRSSWPGRGSVREPSSWQDKPITWSRCIGYVEWQICGMDERNNNLHHEYPARLACSTKCLDPLKPFCFEETTSQQMLKLWRITLSRRSTTLDHWPSKILSLFSWWSLNCWDGLWLLLPWQ